ncbi:MAG: Flp pilus assembly protein CpaB [Bryobacteraceae bacterium]|nr:Flp pilus assembly protein CpaB [Bryobacteraceae bacterium]MDW8378555.1 Flp pilus assembly protein CpaB [Bryobacterales bacterium]
MDRRFITVLGVSLVFALLVSSLFYQMTARAGAPRKVDQTEMKDLVVAAKPLSVGITVKPADVKVTKVAADQFPKGGFSKVEEVIDRPVISNILLDEPLLEGRLATRGSGLGIAPIIPVGMRAVTVRVNDVVGVAGFVMPGMRVDVLVTGRPPGQDGTVTTTVLQNILVLTAGTTTQPDARGQAINAPNVTLLVTPEQAEILTLASNEGRIQLVLRNGADQAIERTPGRQLAELFGTAPKQQQRHAEEAPRPRPRPVVVAQAAPAPPPPPPAPPVDQVVVIRGNQKTVETVSNLTNP